MFLRIWYDKSAEEVKSYNEKDRDGEMKKKLAIIGTVALLGVGAVALSNQEWRANTIFATARDKQLAWLKEHEEEIVKFVKSKNSKIESVQMDWNSLTVEQIGNGTPQGGGEIVNVYGSFNHIESSSWNVTFDIENGEIIPNSMALANYLRVGGKIFD